MKPSSCGESYGSGSYEASEGSVHGSVAQSLANTGTNVPRRASSLNSSNVVCFISRRSHLLAAAEYADGSHAAEYAEYADLLLQAIHGNYAAGADRLRIADAAASANNLSGGR